MNVSQLRNLAEQEIPLDPGLNILIGANGHGKTSVLEAVYLLGTTRSFRTTRLGEVVRFGGGPARIGGIGANPGEELAVLVGAAERQYLRDGKAVSAAEYIGAMDVIALSNDIVAGFRRKPSERRRFLDRMAVATWPAALGELGALRRACSQRASLAAAGTGGPERRAWDRRAAELALPIERRREEMARALEAHLRGAAAEVFPEGSSAHVRLVARPDLSVTGEAGYVDALDALFAAQGPSAGRRETPAGPLRDDLAIDVGGMDLLRYGSAGQIRSLLAAAVLAEMTRLRQLKGRYPVLVLDDLDADLDESRYGALVRALGGSAQVITATSKPALASKLSSEGRRFFVREGVVSGA